MSKELTRYEKSFKVKRQDRVLVTAGKSKGETGVVLRVDRTNDRVYIRGVNLAVSRKKNKAAQSSSGSKIEMPVHISNVTHYVELDGKITPSKVHYEVVDGKKVRVLTKTGAVIQEPSYSKAAVTSAEEVVVAAKEEAPKKKKATSKKKEEVKEEGEQE